MGIEDWKPSLTETDVLNIKLFCDVARANGSAVSIKDLVRLTATDYSEEQLADSWDNYRLLSSRYRVASGIVLEKSFSENLDEQESTARQEITERYDRANINIDYACRFSTLLTRADRSIKVLSISGSTSYLSVSEMDDLDFFCIMRSQSMWTGFVRTLILARAFRLANKNAPWICMSYVSDEDFVRREFQGNQNGLFARDAISTLVVSGEGYFQNLLKENSWMSSYFPKLYNLRLKKEGSESSTEREEKPASSISRIVNLFLYYTAGSYIRLKSYLLNRKFSQDRKFSSLFKLRIGPDHCIYESADYVRLRKLYSTMKKKSGT